MRLLAEIEALVVASALPPGALTFEITETAAIADIAGLQLWARRLKELGCGFALDDFGTGFSSFAYLQALPVDLVKIDGSFLRDLDANPTNRALVRAMVAHPHALGKTVVAEMVAVMAGLGAKPRGGGAGPGATDQANRQAAQGTGTVTGTSAWAS